MNWIKKLLNLIDVDSRESAFYKEENEQAVHKHIEAKVSYQYPKGNFRFPVIPDKKEEAIRRREKRVEKQSGSKIKKENDERGNQRAIATNSRKVNKGKQPFRPTEIPSPVYGFNRPNQVKIIEYELQAEKDSYTKRLEDAAPSVDLPIENKCEHQENMENQTELNESVKKSESNDFMNLLSDLRETNKAEACNDNDNYDKETIVTENKVLAENECIATNDAERAGVADLYFNHQVNEGTSDVGERNEPNKNGRRIVPYNVIMLKQDKQKLPNGQRQADVQKQKQLNYDTDHKEGDYYFPPMAYLNQPPKAEETDEDWLIEQRDLLNVTLENFNVRAKVVNVSQGPSVTRFEVHPEPGVKVNKVTNLADDIKLSLAAKDIRIEAPIPGKNTIGIEVPNRYSKPVMLSEILQTERFRHSHSSLTVALGLDISGNPIVTDLNKMPHGLIAGATGSGKSVCINAILVSLLYKAAPHEVKLVLIDPKMVELAPYNDIPHLVSPVITDVKAATAALKWAVEEMERRYELFAHTGVREIGRFNELAKGEGNYSEELPYIIIIIDELADLMMVAPGDVEEAICRIAQKARACGIHLIVATQRPSVDVITGLIKANIPTRIAFSVSSQVDSRTIIDSNGADKLLGKGDMLFLENGSSKPIRVQGNFVSDEEIERVVTHVKQQQSPSYLFEQEELIKKASINNEEEELFYEACEFIVDQGGASTSSLQRHFRIGYNRAARLIDLMEEQGIISEARGSKPREVLISEDELSSFNNSTIS